MDASLLLNQVRRRMRVAMPALSVSLLVFALAGCGDGDQKIADDPSAVGTGLEDIDDSPDARAFENESIPIDRDTPSADDLDPNALPPQVADVYFGYDEHELDAESRSVLQTNASLLRTGVQKLMIEGHCDERGTAQYNMALGWKRANEVQRYLVSLGIDAARIETVSYGKERPFAAGTGEANWAQNRRAHFRTQASVR